jgi:acyl dehydratase
MTSSDDWKSAWQPMIDSVGRQFEEGPRVFSADEIERSAVRRYLEPLEFDCPLHYDRETARAYGYADILVPTSALPTFALGPMWRPGDVLFASADRNAQPTSSALRWITAPMEPPTTGYFATNFDVEYLQPAVVGDRLLRFGAKLLGCQPKETKVGRGAFLTWESNIINQRHEVVARLSTTFYRYNPHPKD